MDRQSAAEVAEHLAKLGHTRIAMIIGPPTYRSSQERLEGFSNALADRGLTLAPDYIAEGAYTFESGAACAEMLLSRTPRPTAIFAGNDETAAGVYRTAYLRGLRIPHDLTDHRLRRQSAGVATLSLVDHHETADPGHGPAGGGKADRQDLAHRGAVARGDYGISASGGARVLGPAGKLTRQVADSRAAFAHSSGLVGTDCWRLTMTPVTIHSLETASKRPRHWQ